MSFWIVPPPQEPSQALQAGAIKERARSTRALFTCSEKLARNWNQDSDSADSLRSHSCPGCEKKELDYHRTAHTFPDYGYCACVHEPVLTTPKLITACGKAL
ncbi:hypothetical protein QC761_0040760 [Podospora bellae-mahoneyi]|uniref:Uncharacterized protein n=1 Tax=Podospora bellae-mahoneyi TaxID=2093777 RepID=A0ABR0FTE9_9PEZI|nr:hypothetical protein QC761_0040760 [Podospora bellae-mahoneyi]